MTKPLALFRAPADPWPKATDLSLDWQLDAACAFVGPEVSDRMTDAVHHDDVADLAKTYCGRCPVIAECGAAGRKTGGWGLHGGVVLKQGRPAPKVRRADPESLEAEPITAAVPPETELTTSPEPTPEPVAAEPVVSPLRHRGQRRQPRKLPRSKRRTPNRGRAETVCSSCSTSSCDCETAA